MIQTKLAIIGVGHVGHVVEQVGDRIPDLMVELCHSLRHFPGNGFKLFGHMKAHKEPVDGARNVGGAAASHHLFKFGKGRNNLFAPAV